MAGRPWRRDYWLGTVDPRPLAAFRIGVGILVLSDLVTRARQMTVFLTDGGILPRGVQAERWAWSLFDLVGSNAGVAVLLGLAFVVTIAFILGYRTRLATLLTWLFVLSLQNRNLSVGDGGDDLLRVMLMWSLFTDLGGAWSVDVWLGRRPRARVLALGARLMQWQIALVYLAGAYLKMRGTWLDGDAIYQTLQLTGFVRPLGDALLAAPWVCTALTYATLAIELAMPVLLLTPWASRPARTLAVALSTGLQLGILLTMRVGIFTGLMLVIGVLFVVPGWYDAAERWWHRRRGDVSGPAPIAATQAPQFGRLAPAVAIVAILHLGLVGADSLIAQTPAAVEHELQWVGLNQGLDLFTHPFPVAHWHADGVLSDGRTVDVLPRTVPELQPTVEHWFNRWTKLRFKHHLHVREIAAYLCRRYADDVPGPRLVSLTLARDLTMPHRPGERPAPARTEVLWHGRCPAAPGPDQGATR